MSKPLILGFMVALVAMAAYAQDDHGTTATLAPPGAASASSSSSSSTGATSPQSSQSSSDTSSSEASSSSQPVPVVIPPDKKTLRRLTDATRDYVRNQRGWMDGTYTVYFYGYDNDLTVMAIDLTHGDNAYNFVSAEGQPFKVEIDPATMQVKRESY